MDRDDVFGLIALERQRVADMFEGLDETQWTATSLCAEWNVREIAGHLVVPFCVSTPSFALGIVTSGGFHRYSVKVARQVASRPTNELVTLLRDNADNRFVPPASSPMAPLTDLVVHGRDVARPLGLDASAPPGTWRAVLDFLASPRARVGFVPRGRLAGLRLVATDQEWVAGQGSELRGPSEALALAVAGRSVALTDLVGDGVPLLEARLSGAG